MIHVTNKTIEERLEFREEMNRAEQAGLLKYTFDEIGPVHMDAFRKGLYPTQGKIKISTRSKVTMTQVQECLTYLIEKYESMSFSKIIVRDYEYVIHYVQGRK